MATGTSAKSSQRQLEPAINVTPLVDVMLVLLIIFMVITPTLAEGADIDLPSILSVDKTPKELEPIDVALLKSGAVMLDKTPIGADRLEGRLRDLHEKDPHRRAMLKADSLVPYKRVRETFAMLQQIGFHGVALRVVQRKGQGAS
jgi:biopolymer transport protein TolR